VIVVDRTDDFQAAFEQAIAAKYPSLLELRVDPDAITPSSRLSEISIASGSSPGFGLCLKLKANR
jgi:acetolactate synthase I/II/III large subunit